MLDAFGNPSLLVKVRQLHRHIADLLIKEPIDWALLIDFVPIEEWTTTKRRSIAEVTKGVTKGQLINWPVLEHIEKLLHMIFWCGNVKGNLINRLLIEPTPAATTPAKTQDATTIWPSNRSSKQETWLSISPEITRALWVPSVSSCGTLIIENYTNLKLYFSFSQLPSWWM